MRLPSDSAAALLVLDDSELVERVARDDHAAFETLMRRHNSRLFRVARAILRDDVDAEDALQDAYLDAYRHIGDFRGDAQLATWLTRIVINHALMRLRRRRRDQSVVIFREHWAMEPGGETGPTEADVADEESRSPSGVLLRDETRRLLERRIDDLPVAFRMVFVMRDVDDMSVQETAECLAHTGRNGPDAPVPGSRAAPRGPGSRPRRGHRRRVRVRRGALRPHRGRSAGALRSHSPGLNVPRR